MRENEHWVEEEHMGYDELRYDPDEVHTDCLECGTELRGFGDRAGAGSYCPDCEVLVMSI